MAKAMKCDICGKYFEIINGDINCVKKSHKDKCGQFNNTSSADACPECVKSIEAHIESLKPVKAEPKTISKSPYLEVVTCKGYLHYHNGDSLGKDKMECVVTVILNKNGQVNNIHSVVTDDWEYRCEVEPSMKEVQDLAGNTYHCKTEKFMWYMRRPNQPHDGWIFNPNIAYLEYQI